MKVADLGVDPRIVEVLREQGIEDLYPPQERAIPIALEGKSLVLAIPTASGKSLVAYLAVLKHVLNGGKAMYIVPLRALATEKYDDLKAFEALGVKVGISMGDYDSPDPTLGRYDVIVSTSERADSLLRHRADWLAKLTCVVADEVHLINDADRGPTLEVTLAKMRQVNPRLQVVALSATIRNSAELAAWLKAEHVWSDWRPVPLRAGVMFDGTVLWTDRKTTHFNATEDDLSGLVEDIIDTGGQALIFVNTRRSTEALARSLTGSVKARLNAKDLAALKRNSEDLTREQEESSSMANRLARCVQGGTAFHNAGLLNAQRRLVEESFKKGKIKVIVATPTLCLHPDTLITTSKGPVRIADLKSGDEVLTHKGRFRTVTGTSKRPYAGELLAVTADGMLPVMMTPEHRVLRNTRYIGQGGGCREIRRGPKEWTTASELNVGDEVHSPARNPGFGSPVGKKEVSLHLKAFLERIWHGTALSLPSVRAAPQPSGFNMRATGRIGAAGFATATGVRGVNPTKTPEENGAHKANTPVGRPFRAPIRSIERVPYSGEVYNLHIEDDESYVCSFAFAVHNSAGINLPARRVIVRDVTRYDANLGFTPIPVLEIQQMCGRAGRPRYDPYGEAILMAKREEEQEYLLEDYLLAPPEPVESKLAAEPALRVHVLAAIATGHCRSEDELYGFLGQTFFAFERDVQDLRDKVDRVLTFLDKEKFVERGADKELRPTFFGRRTSDLYIDPLSAVKMRDALQGQHDTTFFWLWAACSTPDMPKLYMRRGDNAWIEEKIAEAAFTFEVEDYDFFQTEIKTACLLEDWIEERTEEEVTKRFGVGPGDIRRMVDQGEWLVYAMGELAKIFRRERVKPLSKLIPRLQYGIREELLPLVQLRGVGRVRARNLLHAGYRTLTDLQKASAGDLSRIPTIGNALAISIKEQLGKTIKPQEMAGQTALSEWGG